MERMNDKRFLSNFLNVKDEGSNGCREQNTEERIKQLETLFLLHDCQEVSHE